MKFFSTSIRSAVLQPVNAGSVRCNQAANRCEAVLFLISKAWLAFAWCRKELNLAHHLNKPYSAY